MRLTAQVRLYIQGEEVFRQPSFWDKVKTAFGSDVDLRTGELLITQNVLALTEQVQKALQIAGITNAVTLVVDDEVVFQDLEDRDHDADLLVAAMRRSASRFTGGFKMLRAVFEYQGQGLHSLLEVTVRAKAKKTEPHAVVSFGARIDELRPREGEDIEKAKDRIGKALADAQLVPMYRNVLSEVAAKVQGGLQRAFPTALLESDPADVQVVRPSGEDVRDLGQSQCDRDAHLRNAPVYARSGWASPYYDPWSVYYRDPMDTFVNLMVLDALISPRHHWGYGAGYLGSHWSSYGAPVTVINYNGAPIGNADDIGSYSHQLGGVSDVMDRDFSTASWDDNAMAGYDAGNSSWDQYDTGGSTAAGNFDCAAGDSSSGESSGDSSGWDCAAATDCASSDCSADCSSDCSWDCSSDCSSDCSWDCNN